MKLTRQKLKQIVLEELNRLDEVSNEEVQVATAQAMAQGDMVNGSSDGQILANIDKTLNVLVHLISGLTDKSMQGACEAPINSLRDVLDQIKRDDGTAM